MNNIMESVFGTIDSGLRKAFASSRIIRIDTHSLGDEIVTLEDEQGRLTHELKKNVSKELLEDYKGEVYNRYK